MSDLHDSPDRVQTKRAVFSGMGNAVMSNPELREAYAEAEEQGFSGRERYEWAYRETFGDEYWEREYADRVAADHPDYVGLERAADGSLRSSRLSE